MTAESSNRVFVRNIPYSEDGESLRRHLVDTLGLAPGDVTVVTDRETGASRGFGFASFPTPGAAAEAMDVIRGSELGGRLLGAEPAAPRREGGGRGRR